MKKKKIQHLEMIEHIIERMGHNSFLLKGWSITLISALVALVSQGKREDFFVLAFIPLLAFWFLDAFYLMTERKYRMLYENVRVSKKIDFSMDLDVVTYTGKQCKKICFMSCLFSKTEILFYGFLAFTICGLTIFWNFLSLAS